MGDEKGGLRILTGGTDDEKKKTEQDRKGGGKSLIYGHEPFGGAEE